MHKALLAALLLSALALAGCSGDKGHAAVEPVTCPDGTVLDAETIEADEAHHEDGFDAKTLCPTPPQVLLTGVPATVQAYGKAPFSWSVDPGSVAKGHSMITEIRYATASVPDAEASIETYSKPIIKKEHQDLPVQFKGNMTFNTVGKVYVRAYAAVQGEGYDRRDVWGPEIELEVTPVLPTGVTHAITHSAGLVAGELTGPEGNVQLGDAVSFTNEDVPEYTLTQTSAPPGAPPCELSAAGGGATSSATCTLVVPGSYEFETNGATGAKQVSVSVAVPV